MSDEAWRKGQQAAVEAARAVKKGKADPRGRGRRLAELPESGVEEPWWVRRARHLRRVKRMSYQAIADELGRPYRQVYVALNQKRVRATNRKSDHKNRDWHTERQRAYRKKNAPRCTVCGHKLARPTQGSSDPICLHCRLGKGERDQETLIELFKAGWKLFDIDDYMGRPHGSAGAMVSVLRKRGVDLPYRVAQRPEGTKREGPPCSKCGQALARVKQGNLDAPPVCRTCRDNEAAALLDRVQQLFNDEVPIAEIGRLIGRSESSASRLVQQLRREGRVGWRGEPCDDERRSRVGSVDQAA